MSDAQQLIVTAKSGAEVCAQLVFWTRQLQRALDARRRLLGVAAAGVEGRARGAVMTATSESDEVTSVDLGTWTPQAPSDSPLLVAPCSVPRVRRLNACLRDPALLRRVATRVPGRSLPRQGGWRGGTPRTGGVLVVPESPALRLAGITAQPLPRLLHTAAAPVTDLLEDLS